MPTPDEEAALAQREVIAKEYGEYVAVTAINIGGALAFNAGDPVPKSHVERGVVAKDEVARRNTKAAEAVTGSDT